MKTLMLLTTATAISMATLSFAQEVAFSEIDVTVELGDVENANALEYWPSIEADMEKVMSERVSTMYAPNGVDIDVSVTEVSLSGSKLLSEEGEFNTLRGWVYVRDENNGNLLDTFHINLRAETGDVGFQNGAIKLPEIEAFYDALLTAFADRIVARVQDV